MKKPAQKLAIFDIDGTIFRSSLLIELINGLVDNGVLPKQVKKEIEKDYLAWRDRKGTYEDYLHRVIQIYVKYIAGKSFAQVEQVAQRVISCQKDRVYRYTRDLIQKLKKQKYVLVAISGSPSYIVSKYAKKIGFNLCFGSELEVKNGKFTGRILSVDSADHKSKIIKSLLKEYPGVDLKNSLAVGDTESDIGMLKMVGRPVAFNPNLQLGKYAKKKKWQVVVERKDVIYNVADFKFLDSPAR